MATTTNRLQILVEAKDRASRELQSIQGELGGLSRGFSLLGKGAVVVGTALAALQAGQAAFEMGRASAESMRLADSFRSLASAAGGSSQEMLAAMREASRGMIDDTSLIGAANRAMLLGVADSADEMAGLLEIAGARAKAMGLSTQQAFSDLVTGIGRMSPMILDNLGITIDAEGAYRRFAESVGRSAESLDDAEKKQALVNEVMRTSAGLLAENAGKGRDLAGSFERMDASIANAKDALGALFSPAAAAIAEQIANAVDAATNAMTGPDLSQGTTIYRGLAEDVAAYRAQIAELSAQQASLSPTSPEWVALQVQINALNGQIQQTTASTMALDQMFGGATNSASDLTFEMIAAIAAGADLAAAQHAQAQAAQAAAVANDGLRAQIVGLIDAQRELSSLTAGASGSLRSSFLGMAGGQGAGAALAGFETANRELMAQTALWQQQGRSVEEIRFLQAEYVQGIQAANRELAQTATATSAVGSATDVVAQKFEELKSKVAGVLSGALNTGVGVNPDDFLPRADAINEDARRLADVVVRGFESPWASYLQDKFPEMFSQAMDATGGNVQQAAASLLKDFQEGLNPQLLDKAAAKERVKRMLLGDASMAELAGEIAAELQAEMGGQFSLAQIQSAAGAALGQNGTGAEAGADAGAGMLAGMTDKISGLAEALDVKIREQFTALRESGQRAGGQWGTGFLATVGENIPAPLIEILATVVTPGVWDRIMALQGMTQPGGAN